MMQDDYNIQNPVVNWYYPYDYSQYDPGFQHCGSTPQHLLVGFIDPILNNGASADCQVLEPVPDPYETSSTWEREIFFGNIAREENVYGSLQSSYREAENSLFYTIAMARPDMLNMNDSSDFSFQQYFNNLATSNTGLRQDIYNLIEDGDYAQAYILNNSLMDTSTWDKTSKQVSRIYLDSWCQGQFNFASQDRDSLWSIAHASPYERGNAVFSARVLLGLDPDQVPLPHSQSVGFEPQIGKSTVFYPNPAKDYICFRIEEGQSGNDVLAEVQLLDIVGRPIYQTRVLLIEGENCVSAPQGKSGIYIIRLTSTSGLNESGKIIIR